MSGKTDPVLLRPRAQVFVVSVWGDEKITNSEDFIVRMNKLALPIICDFAVIQEVDDSVSGWNWSNIYRRFI